jgi:AAA+ ATPase superfamily predicted ATPase
MSGIKKEKIVVLYGLRRTGKTSLMRTAFNELECLKAYVDVRSVMPRNKKDLEALFKKTFSSLENLLEKTAASIGGIEVGLASVGLTVREDQRLTHEIAENLDKKGKKIVIFIDEAQLLKKFGADQFIGFLYDNTKNMTIVLGGSEVGILREFSGEEADSPLYGRAKCEVVIKKLEKEKCAEFLRKGFEQLRVKHEEKWIEEAIELIDGIIGWHVLYGHYAVNNGHRKAITKVKKEAATIIRSEINAFLSNKGESTNRYLAILKQLAVREMGWKELKISLEKETKGEIAESRFYSYLENLLKHGFIEKIGETYQLGDPLIPLVTSARK